MAPSREDSTSPKTSMTKVLSESSGGVLIYPINTSRASGEQVSAPKLSPWEVVEAVQFPDMSSVKKSTMRPDVTAFNPKQRPTPLELLNFNSTSDVDAPTIVTSPYVTLFSDNSTGPVKPIGTGSSMSISPLRESFGMPFTTEPDRNAPMPGTRYVAVTNMTREQVKDNDLMSMFEVVGISDKVLYFKHRELHGVVTLAIAFDDLRDAAVAIEDIDFVGAWETRFISALEYFCIDFTNSHADTVTPYAGQVKFTAEFRGLTSEFDLRHLCMVIQAHAKTFGEVRTFKQISTAPFPKFEFRVEYHKLSDCQKALSSTSEQLGTNWVAKCEAYFPEDWKHRHQAASAHAAHSSSSSANTVTSATGRTTWTVSGDRSQIRDQPVQVNAFSAPIAMYGRHPSAPMPTASNSYTGGHEVPRSVSWSGHSNAYHREESYLSPQNVVLGRIRGGVDVRTTIMIRNVPNKVTIHQLQEVLNATSFGLYDFLYLRIDFQANCNVGYAFVNFIAPEYIIPFYNRYIGQRWIQFVSQKIAECSYATVQGKDCLVERFRNSSIMKENPDYRPKIFHTIEDGPERLVGEELPFPTPNNMSKMQRSCDNAYTVGLFPPRTAQHGRDDRRRASQFDRGTPAQMREDAYYGNMAPSAVRAPQYQHMGYPTPPSAMQVAGPRTQAVGPPAFMNSFVHPFNGGMVHYPAPAQYDRGYGHSNSLYSPVNNGHPLPGSFRGANHRGNASNGNGFNGNGFNGNGFNGNGFNGNGFNGNASNGNASNGNASNGKNHRSRGPGNGFNGNGL